ncbi:MAG TPA: NAD(P)H-dependent glycerol-3-phosphate dehydrogenase [Xanthobacteraceae bacterium]|jgi:glycerol-3-phosphate dehydrogenase (NAD(P)+)
MNFERIIVVGAGAWGSALANVIARAGRAVTLAARDAGAAAAIERRHESLRLPGYRLDERIRVVAAGDGADAADAVLLAVPSQQLRSAAVALVPSLRTGTPIVACAKGIEQGSRKFMTEVIAESAPRAVPAILSGPSFASDVARGMPTAVTLAAEDENLAAALAAALGSTALRPYRTTDVRGVEIGGAAKNVFGIAAGIVSGRGMGASAGAALITRSFAELVRFGMAFGARAETMTGLSGFGDLVLTCSSLQSRNFSLGVALGKGEPPAEARKSAILAEGLFTAPVLVEMAKARGVEMPIAAAVAAILDEKMSVTAAIESLLTRPFRAER